MQLKLNTDVTCTPAHVQSSCLNSYGSRRLCGKFKMTECLHFYCKVRISEANISYCSLTSPYLWYPAPSVPRIYRRGSDGPVEQQDLILTEAPSFPGELAVLGTDGTPTYAEGPLVPVFSLCVPSLIHTHGRNVRGQRGNNISLHFTAKTVCSRCCEDLKYNIEIEKIIRENSNDQG